LRQICPVCAGEWNSALSRPPEPAGDTVVATKPETEKPLPLTFEGFELLDVLNRGGMGVVYRARQLGLNRLVALKVIAPERMGDETTLKRFQREVQAAALLSHPNIVTVYHTDLRHRPPYLAMEYVEGIDLRKVVEAGGPVAEIDACNYILQAARGLAHAHERGLVHRDIKPANLMVTPSPLDRSKRSKAPCIKILDMGLARIVEPGEGAELTQADMFLGTPDYSSPEQAEDSRKADIRSDLYSLGGTLYFLLTGEPPFPNCSIVEKYRRQITEAGPSPAARRPGVWPVLDALVRLLMDPDPDDRIQTPAELIDILEAAMRDPSAPLPRNLPAVAKAAPLTQVSAHAGGVTSLAIGSAGRLIISGGMDETIKVWDAVRMCETRCISKDVGSVRQVCIAPGSKWAASCSLRLFKRDMVVQLWDLSDGGERRRLRGATDNIRCLAVSHDGRRVAGGSSDGSIRIWAVEQPASPTVVLTGHTGEINALAFLSGGTMLISGGNDGTLRLWDLNGGASKGILQAGVGKVQAIAVHRASGRVAVAGDGLRIRHTDGTFKQLHGHTGPVLCAAISPDGKFLVSGGSDQTVRIWRTEDGKELRCLRGHSDRVCSVAFRPDAKAVYSGSADGAIRYWPWLS
jgi:hypothetical protein